MMRKYLARKLMLAAAVAAAIPAFAEQTPMALPAHFVPTEADYNASVALPTAEEPYWEFGNYYIDGDWIDAFGCYEDYNVQADYWLILPQLATEAGGSHTISYSAVTRNGIPADYSVCWGTAPTPEAMTNTIYSVENFSTMSNTSEKVEQNFEVPAGQNVYVGLHVTSPRGSDYVNLKVFDITVAGAAVDNSPEAPAFGIVMDGLKGVATVTFPDKTVSGNALDGVLMKAEIVIDGNDKTKLIVDGDPGAVVPKDFTAAPGEHTAVCTVSYEDNGTTLYSKPVSQKFVAEIPEGFTLELPLSFTPSADNIAMLTIIDANEDGKTWQVMDTYPDELRIQENWKLAANDWAILPPVEVKQTGKYKFTLRAAAQSANCPESVELCLGTAPTAEAMKTTVLKLENFKETRRDDNTLPLFEAECVIEEAGKYYLGIHGFSQKDMLTLSVGTVTMEKTPYEYLDPEAYAQLPENMYDLTVTEACQEGVRFTVKAQDQLMIYTNAIFDERYLTVDNLTDEDFADHILYISNQALSIFGSWDKAQEAEFFYFGDRNIENAIVNPAGTRSFVAVMGLLYDEATNTVTPLTRLCRSEVFEYTDGTFSQEEPWAEMVNPVYMESRGKKVVRVDIELNSTAEDAYGKGFAPDYRDHNSDYEIIQYLTSYSNMSETLISPMHLDVALEPGEKSLLCVTTTDRNGKASKRLNWMLVEAPAEIGQEVKVLASATAGSGIGSIVVDGDEGEAEYFDMQGRRVDTAAPAPGIYIRRCGGKSTKVVVR